jgi:hypothetical protein
MPAKDDPDSARDAKDETKGDPEVKKVSDGFKQKGE